MSIKDIKTKWDLSKFYKSVDDPAINIDVKKADKIISFFEKKYKKNDSFLKNENSLLTALKDYEKIDDLSLNKPLVYLSYAQALNSQDEKIRAKLNLISQEFNRIINKILFFGIKLSKIDKKYQKKFLNSKKLSHYKYFLEKIFESGKYVLSESEEKILSLKSLTSSDLWSDLTDKLENRIIIEYKKEKMPLSKAFNTVYKLPTQQERLELHNKITDELSKIADVAAAELVAIVTDKKINDELRKYKEPYDATIIGYENDKKSIINLVKTVTDNFKVSQRFYKVKAKMLGLKKLNYSDRGAEIDKTSKKLLFKDSYNILQNVFDSIDKDFGDILRKMAISGSIDVYPNLGKSGGAFCSHNINLPTMVFLNHTDDIHSHMTFAHEMGHAIHSELSKSQSAMYQDYSTSTAEVASTLFESFAFYDALEKMMDDEKIIALHDKISDDISTIFRQIACFNFEVEMHQTIRKQGSLSKEDFCHMMNKHMKSYLGDIFELTPQDGMFFVSWSHLRYMFYVYTYAFGQLSSKALYKKYSEDKKYVEKIKKFLSLGGSKSPEDIFKSIGIDIKKPDFWKKGIESINDDIESLERLVNKR